MIAPSFFMAAKLSSEEIESDKGGVLCRTGKIKNQA